ncbi:MAG: YceI family protein [Acidimicrobiia bacterium]|nr:YceI family protein [Acidimicrobiia bacterium]NNC74540.1 YceI family protein [Acidimicrobiia bacterium]
MNRNRWIVVAGVVGVVAAAAFFIWFFGRSTPDEVSLEDAISSVSSTSTTTTVAASGSDDTTTTTTAAAPEGVDGTWTVDPSIGEFSFDDATSSFAGFRINEELSSLGSVTAVGRTPGVSGSFTLEGSTMTAASFEADLTQIVTDDSRRDNKAKGALEVSTFPTATFTVTSPIDLGVEPAEGTALSIVASGDLNVHGVTRQVEFPLEAQLVGDVIVVVGSINIVFADYDVELPSAPIVLSVEDNGILEVQLFFTR